MIEYSLLEKLSEKLKELKKQGHDISNESVSLYIHWYLERDEDTLDIYDEDYSVSIVRKSDNEKIYSELIKRNLAKSFAQQGMLKYDRDNLVSTNDVTYDYELLVNVDKLMKEYWQQ